MVDLATRILLHDKTRFAITVSGVAFAVALVFVQVGLFEGLLSTASITIQKIDAELWVTPRNTPNIDFANSFPESLVNRVRSVPGVLRADNLIVCFADVALPTGAKETAEVYALEHFDRWGLPWNVASGNPRDLRRGKYVILDESAVKRFGPFQVGQYREFMGQRLKIIGKTREAKSFTTTPIAFVDYRMAQSLNSEQLENRSAYILVKLKDPAQLESVRAEIARRLPYNDVHTRAEWARLSRSYWVDSTGLGLNMYTTVFLGCLVGIVVVAQTLYTATMEHLPEFATVKAMGGRNADIYRILAKQATIAAVTGFALGISLAFSLRPALASLDLDLLIQPSLALAVFVGTLVLCIAAAALSFRKVATLDPALVFRG